MLSFDWPVAKSVGAFSWLIDDWRGRTLGQHGQCHPWESDPELYRKAVRASQGSKPGSMLLSRLLLRFRHPGACPGFLSCSSRWTISSQRNTPFLSQVALADGVYHSNRNSTKTWPFGLLNAWDFRFVDEGWWLWSVIMRPWVAAAPPWLAVPVFWKALSMHRSLSWLYCRYHLLLWRPALPQARNNFFCCCTLTTQILLWTPSSNYLYWFMSLGLE